MKPIFRWTIGKNTRPLGYEILKRSIEEALNVFKDEFDWIVCFNLEPNQLNTLKKTIKNAPVTLFQQDWNLLPIPEKEPQKRTHDLHLHHTFGGSLWKIAPPRLQIKVHEIIIDNDVVITKRIKEIDQFLNSNKTLISEDCCRFFGRYDPHLPHGVCYNSGIIGLPPGFDFGHKTLTAWENTDKLKEITYADEQGLLSYVLSNEEHIIIPTKKVPILHANHYAENNFLNTHGPDSAYISYDDNFLKIMTNCYGFHFVEANRLNFHTAWNIWK